MSRAERTNRPKRTPLGMRNILTTDQRPGYVRRWVNDVEDRVKQAKEAGYEPVMTQTEVGDERVGADTQMGAIVSRSVGGGRRAVLMEIPKVFYDEDQAAKQKRVDHIEAGLQPGRGDGQYGDLTIESKRASRSD